MKKLIVGLLMFPLLGCEASLGARKAVHPSEDEVSLRAELAAAQQRARDSEIREARANELMVAYREEKKEALARFDQCRAEAREDAAQIRGFMLASKPDAPKPPQQQVPQRGVLVLPLDKNSIDLKFGPDKVKADQDKVKADQDKVKVDQDKK